MMICLKICSISYQSFISVQLAFVMKEKKGYNSLVPEELEVFNLINNTGPNEAQPAPNCEDFIQNSLIRCFINLEPQAEMFKAAGQLEPAVQGKRANKGETEELSMHVCQQFIRSPYHP